MKLRRFLLLSALGSILEMKHRKRCKIWNLHFTEQNNYSIRLITTIGLYTCALFLADSFTSVNVKSHCANRSGQCTIPPFCFNRSKN